jgi:hypothetical protein
MKTKKQYKSPEIKLINLDSEISLQLFSSNTPTGEPLGPDWVIDANNDLPINFLDDY